jgi:dUTPase
LAAKHFIDTGAGVIDADYRGQVKVLLFNHGEAEFKVKEGERVAQLVLERVGLSAFICHLLHLLICHGWASEGEQSCIMLEMGISCCARCIYCANGCWWR